MKPQVQAYHFINWEQWLRPGMGDRRIQESSRSPQTIWDLISKISKVKKDLWRQTLRVSVHTTAHTPDAVKDHLLMRFRVRAWGLGLLSKRKRDIKDKHRIASGGTSREYWIRLIYFLRTYILHSKRGGGATDFINMIEEIDLNSPTRWSRSTSTTKILVGQNL